MIVKINYPGSIVGSSFVAHKVHEWCDYRNIFPRSRRFPFVQLYLGTREIVNRLGNLVKKLEIVGIFKYGSITSVLGLLLLFRRVVWNTLWRSIFNSDFEMCSSFIEKDVTIEEVSKIYNVIGGIEVNVSSRECMLVAEWMKESKERK
jgi:hypothetical protein